MRTLALERPEPRFSWPAWREHSFALGVAVALHMALGFALLNLADRAPLAPAVPTVIKTQLVSLPAPAVQPPPPPAVADVPAPPAPAPEPLAEAPRVEPADLALKRVEQARREQTQRAERERQRQRREEERQREQRARQEQQRQAQRLAQARQAESERQAAADAADAAARARAEAEAASRQYLPIAKQAPDYPQRALDRRIEGECTVVYTVNAQGRVEAPQVAGPCHPLFIAPSLAAAKRFRYQPRIVDGQAVAVRNVKNTFSYRIE